MLDAPRLFSHLPVVLVSLVLASCGGDSSGSGNGSMDHPTILRDAEEAPPGTAFIEPPTEAEIVVRRTVYVPVHSRIFISETLRPFSLAATLSIRNTDPNHPIIVMSARFYDTAGTLVRSELRRPLRIDPMGSVDTFLPPDDANGGPGANYLVEWAATAEVNEPVIQALMVGTAGGHGISFLTDGRPVAHSPSPPTPGSKPATPTGTRPVPPG